MFGKIKSPAVLALIPVTLVALMASASAAVTQWNATDTASVVDPIVTSVHDNVIYFAVTIGPYAVALGFAFLVWGWFRNRSRHPGRG